ncbi:hypothetical protein, conserved [Leishmania tarentolae]|uniref:Uncharacterized protein n=1 Tax=Leishmania tarentolae TaxID=5689 RepID=A0A640KGG9_LEITA|nr:hypothetical protein, conserved [Leishmania tarentolae]
MIFTIINAVLSAILFVLVVVPPLHIYNPDYDSGESSRLVNAGEVLQDESVTQDVKQKLYLLLMIPVCTTINALFLYFAYYRPVRFAHYRVELNLLTLRLTLEARRQQLQKSGVLTVSNRSLIGGGASASRLVMQSGRASSLTRSRMSTANVHFDQDNRQAQRVANSVSWEWRRHVRPKNVRKDAWVNSAVFAEIGDLRDQVEQHFLMEASVAEANFTKAVVKTVDVFLPSVSAVGLGQVTSVAVAAKERNGFYFSSHPPLSSLGSPRPSLGGMARHHMLNGGKDAQPPRRNVVPLVQTEGPQPNRLLGSMMPMSSSGGGRTERRVESKFGLSRGVRRSSWGRRDRGAALRPSMQGNMLERSHEPVDSAVSPDNPEETARQWGTAMR